MGLRVQEEEDRRNVYRMRSVLLDPEARPTTETLRQGDLIFDALPLPGYKREEKRRLVRAFLHAGKRAASLDAVVRYCRTKGSLHYSGTVLQVAEALVGAGYFEETRSRPGSKKMSRLRPTPKLVGTARVDPWTVEEPSKKLVFLRRREDKEEISFDPSHPVASEVQRKLEAVHALLSGWEVTYRRWREWERCFGPEVRLRPVHFARFTDDFDTHGRLYTGHYGHQGLRRAERQTIRFQGEPGWTWDFSGMFPRLLYHLKLKTDFRGDPYALWGERTTPPLRLMAKVFLNTLINARSPESAVDACNRKMSTYTGAKGGPKKTGKSLEDAQLLYRASRETGVKFSDLLPLVYCLHEPIREYFGQDLGIRLMRVESRIALNVLYSLSRKAVPCLGCHDGFMVPESARGLLKRKMEFYYLRETGFLPVLKNE
jgi:hypothetical protein